jgi:hypothetical protein
MTRRSLLAATFLLVVAVGCGDDGGDDVTTETSAEPTPTTEADGSDTSTDGAGAGPLGPATTEALGFEAFQELPQPTGDTATADRPPITGWDGSAVLIGPAGGLVRLGVGEGAEVTPTDGIDVGEPGTTVRAVDLLASSDDELLALGHQEELVADVVPTVFPVAWRSTDGDEWAQLDVTGLESGSDEVTVTAVVADPDGGWLAGGEVDDGNQTTLTLWSSEDGEAWDVVDSPGLDHTDTEEEGEELVSLAILGDTTLVVRKATGLDDERLSILRSTDGGDFDELEPGGLDALDLPNSDILPTVASVGDQFVMFASTPVDEEFGERTPTLFVSGDGEDWAAVPLDGPTLPDPFFVQAITGTEAGAVAVAEGEDALNVWRFTNG